MCRDVSMPSPYVLQSNEFTCISVFFEFCHLFFRVNSFTLLKKEVMEAAREELIVSVLLGEPREHFRLQNAKFTLRLNPD